MLQQPIYSLFIRLIPEAFLIIYSICILSNSKVDLKKIFFSSVIGGIGVYLSRLMPVHFGVHTILSCIMYVFIAVKLNNIEIYKAIAGTLITTVICFIADLTIVIFYTRILNLPIELISGRTLKSMIYSIPSLILVFAIIQLIAYFKRRKSKDVQSGRTI